MCGEKTAITRLLKANQGSPPRVRGKAGLVQIVGRLRRITPACAGKSTCMAQSLKPREHHPRVCGEKIVVIAIFYPLMGSPPRMRGKAAGLLITGRGLGITPAYAGKSTGGTDAGKSRQDHPRVCGEKRSAARAVQAAAGSPPRMRGKGRYIRGHKRPQGITPAYAGKRLKRSHSIGHFSCILCLFHSVLHRASASGGSRAGPCAPPCLPAQNAVPV